MRYELTDFEWTAIRPFLPNRRVAFPVLTPGAS
jgi:transposase